MLEAHLQNAAVRKSRAGRVPDEKLAMGLADLCYQHEDIGNQVVPVVVRLWMESKSDLRTSVEESLRSNNISVVTSSDLGFEANWSPDSYRDVTNQIRAGNTNEPSGAVDLMIYCLTGRAPAVSEDGAQEFLAAPFEIDFDEWLSTLRDLPENSKRWDAYTRFSKTAADIYADKRRLAILGPVFRDFLPEAGAIKELFGYSDCESWTAADFDSSVLEQVADDLRTMIAKLRVLNRPLSGSYQEQVSQFDERKAAGQVISRTYARLSAMRNQSGVSRIPPTLPGVSPTQIAAGAFKPETRTAAPAEDRTSVAGDGRVTPRTRDIYANAAQLDPDPRMLRIGAVLSRDTTAAASQTTLPGGLESPTGSATTAWNVIRPLSEYGNGLTTTLDDNTWSRNQPVAQGLDVLGRHPQKAGVAQDLPSKGTNAVATWQSWEKTALDRKFMIVIGILGVFCLGTIIAIVGITHKILTEGQKTSEARPVVEDSTPALQATVTLKLDGSRFSGTVVRREQNSITMTGAGGVVRTFLESELSDIKYTAQDGPTDSPKAAANKPGAATPKSSADRVIEFPKGTQFPVRSVGLLDSSTVLPGAIFVGVTDTAVKNPVGKVLIPEGANVTFGLVENKKIDGRISMTFELDSADFDGHHYVVSPAAGKPGPGVMASFAGAKEGSPEARTRGLNVHLDNEYFMGFQAAMPVTFKLSE